MRRVSLILLLLLPAFTSCGDDYKSSIPDVKVNFSCSLVQNPYYIIQTDGQFIPVAQDSHYLPIGYAGLIIGRSIYGDYCAYDAACPVEAKRSVAVEVQEDGLGTAVCPVCGTKYNLSEGGFPQKKGGEYLKRYKVTVNGTTLRVSN